MSNQTGNGSNTLVVREAGIGPVHDVLGVIHTYKALADETGGLVSIWETAVPPGAGAPRHSHTGEDEAFYVLEGEVTVEAAGQERPIVLGAGGFIYSPRGIAHAFRNSGGGILRMLVMCVPGGIEHMFGEIDAVAPSHRTPDMAKLVDAAARHGVSIQQSD
jgi:quercetin dioxygenase-like cupin family protein